MIFPANNIWNARVDALPVHPNSAAFLATIGAAGLRCDDVMPVNFAAATDPLTPVATASPEGDPGDYRIPANPALEPGSVAEGDDVHLLVLDADGALVEMYQAQRTADGWTAGNVAKFDTTGNALRPLRSTGTADSADAAGLPMLPGIVQWPEIQAGVIAHTLRMTMHSAGGANITLHGDFQWPARHSAGLTGNTDATKFPPMGARMRLKAEFDLSSYSGPTLVILRALQQYGAMIADNGLPFAMQHDQDPGWATVDVTDLHSIRGAMEFVDTSVLMIDPDSGEAAPYAPPTPPAYVTVADFTAAMATVNARLAALEAAPPPPVVTPPASGATLFGLTASPNPVKVGAPVTITVILTAPATADTVVTLFSTNGVFENSVTVPEGATQKAFAVVFQQTGPLLIIGGLGSVQKSVEVTVAA